MSDDAGVMQNRSQLGQGYAGLTRLRIVAVVIGLQLSLLLAALDQTVVSTAMPRIVAQLSGFEQYSWVTSIYLLMSTAAVPIFGRLSDFYGRKLILLSGILGFVFSSWLCGSAGALGIPIDGMSQLILARALQGMAGGTIMTLTFTVVADIFSPAERGRYQGLFAAVFALAAIAGPTLGGYLADHFSWRWTFFINLPVGILAMAVLYWSLPNPKSKLPVKAIDYAGVGALLGFLFPFLLALTQANKQGWLSMPVLGLLFAAACMALVLIWAERRALDPILPPIIFKNSVVAISLFSVFVTGIGMFGSILLIPLFMQSVVGLSAAKSGALLTPLMVTVAVFSIISGQIIARTGRYKLLVLGGLSLMAVGTFFLAGINLQTGVYMILMALLITGAGLGTLLPLYTIVVQSVVPVSMLGIGTALSQFFRSIGGALGTAVFASLMISRYQSALISKIPAEFPRQSLGLLSNPLDALHFRSQLALVLTNFPDGKQLAETIFHQSRECLVYAIDDVFLIYAFMLVLTLVLNCFLKEVPLRRKTYSGDSI